jgi:hypothetical protein
MCSVFSPPNEKSGLCGSVEVTGRDCVGCSASTLVRFGAVDDLTQRLDEAGKLQAQREWDAECKKFYKIDKALDAANGKFLQNQWSAGPFHNDFCFGLRIGIGFVSYNATRFSTKKHKNAWGRYIHAHLAYTPVQYRRRGYAKLLFQLIEHLAFESGYSRVKSICQTYLGFRLHRSLGHEFWGLDKRGKLIVDSALNPADAFPAGIPIEARCAVNPHLWTPEELETHWSHESGS